MILRARTQSAAFYSGHSGQSHLVLNHIEPRYKDKAGSFPRSRHSGSDSRKCSHILWITAGQTGNYGSTASPSCDHKLESLGTNLSNPQAPTTNSDGCGVLGSHRSKKSFDCGGQFQPTQKTGAGWHGMHGTATSAVQGHRLLGVGVLCAQGAVAA